MSLTAISSLEPATTKFFMNSTYIMSRKLESNVLGSGGRNEYNTHQLARMGEKKIFHELTANMCKNLESNVLGLRRPH